MVDRETAFGFELSNRIDIAVSTNNFRAIRGRPVLCAILDEIAFWRDDTSATPDTETYNAIKPGTATMPGSMIIGISSPYRKAGLLHKKYRDHYGKPGKVLVVRAPTELLNLTIDRQIIADALAEDPTAARAEWLAEFRDDIAAFVTQEAIDACVSPECWSGRGFTASDSGAAVAADWRRSPQRDHGGVSLIATGRLSGSSGGGSCQRSDGCIDRWT